MSLKVTNGMLENPSDNYVMTSGLSKISLSSSSSKNLSICSSSCTISKSSFAAVKEAGNIKMLECSFSNKKFFPLSLAVLSLAADLILMTELCYS